MPRCPDCDQRGFRETSPDVINVGNGQCGACHGRGEVDGKACQVCMSTGVCQTCGGTGMAEE